MVPPSAVRTPLETIDFRNLPLYACSNSGSEGRLDIAGVRV